MAKTPSVSGHAINLAHFKQLHQNTIIYAGAYVPVNPLIKPAALLTLITAADKVMKDLKTAETAHKLEAAKRRNVFKPIRPLSTRIVNAFRTAGLMDEVVAQAESINKKIQGTASKGKKDDTDATVEGEESKKNVSNAQQSMDDMVEHWGNLVELAEKETGYQPAETDLTVATMKTFLIQMTAANDACRPLYSKYYDALTKRDELLYADKTGLVDRSAVIKDYVAQVYGFSSAQAKTCRGIELKRFNK